MQTRQISRSQKPTGQPALVNSGEFGGRKVHIIPEKYLDEGFLMVEDQEFGIRLILKKEELNVL